MLKTILLISLLFSYLKGEGGGEKDARKREGEGDREGGVEGDGGGSVVDGRRGYRCTLPTFPCTRYSHNCCHGGSCR